MSNIQLKMGKNVAKNIVLVAIILLMSLTFIQTNIFATTDADDAKVLRTVEYGKIKGTVEVLSEDGKTKAQIEEEKKQEEQAKKEKEKKQHDRMIIAISVILAIVVILICITALKFMKNNQKRVKNISTRK